MGVALVAAYWCLNVPAQAQGISSTYPSPVGAARMPEPIPCGPSFGPPPPPQPNLVPGPISPQAAPPGPPDCLSLPFDHSSAFQCEEYVHDGGVYVNFGPMALQRNKLGAGDIAVLNARSQGIPVGHIIDGPFRPPSPGTGSALDFNSVTPSLSLGIRGTVGYLWDSQAVEFTSFYIWQNDSSAFARAPGMIDTLFFNPPLTLAGDHVLRRADDVTLTQGSSLFNAETNYRRWNTAFGGLELIGGIRYIRQNDSLGIMTEGTSVIRNSLGLPTPGRDAATYGVLTHNNIFAPQIGLEYNWPLFRWLSFSVMGKAALGANYITSDVSLQRGDGLNIFDTKRTAWNLGQIYELGMFSDFHLLDRLRLRLGYTSTWLCGVAVANDQVDFNLYGNVARQGFGIQNIRDAFNAGNIGALRQIQQGIPHGHSSNNGSLIYFGPQIELQFFF
jgi:hypothetical protein